MAWSASQPDSQNVPVQSMPCSAASLRLLLHGHEQWDERARGESSGQHGCPIVLVQVLVLDLSGQTLLRFGLGTFFGLDSALV